MSIYTVNQAPEGTKIWILDLGRMEADEGFLLRGGGTSTLSNPNPTSPRRRLAMIACLISHPTEGLLLFECGSGKDYPNNPGPPVTDIFARVDYVRENELDVAIERTGNSIKDVKAVIMGHLHLDHAGGLEYFNGMDVPIYVHEVELKHAFFSVASKFDYGVYQPGDLTFNRNWKPFSGPLFELAPGINLIHSPGHTPGLCIMQINLRNSGTWLFTTDMYHVRENFWQDQPQGWLARDHDDWCRSHQFIKSLQKRTAAKMVFGHCRETMLEFNRAPEFYD